MVPHSIYVTSMLPLKFKDGVLNKSKEEPPNTAAHEVKPSPQVEFWKIPDPSVANVSNVCQTLLNIWSLFLAIKHWTVKSKNPSVLTVLPSSRNSPLSQSVPILAYFRSRYPWWDYLFYHIFYIYLLFIGSFPPYSWIIFMQSHYIWGIQIF